MSFSNAGAHVGDRIVNSKYSTLMVIMGIQSNIYEQCACNPQMDPLPKGNWELTEQV